METMLSDPLLQVYCNLTTLQTLGVPQALLMRGVCRKCRPPIDYLPMTTLQALSVPQALLMRGLCRKSRRLVDVSSMWAILEAELNKANTFNVCSHGEYFDEDCKPFRFRTMLRQEKREIALEVRKLSSDECTKVVHIIKKERLFGQVLSRCSVSEIEDYLDSLSASTQSEIVLFMHGLHPGKGAMGQQRHRRQEGVACGAMGQERASKSIRPPTRPPAQHRGKRVGRRATSDQTLMFTGRGETIP